MLVAITAMAMMIPVKPVSAHGNEPVVHTNDGNIRGKTTSQGRSFLGVPFAAPPVGELRWKSPAKVASWNGVKNTTEFKSPCAALPLPAKVGIPSRNGSTNEDCLYLNVYTPQKTHKNTPVMVFIHGGGFQNGAGSDHEGDVMAAKSGAIVVTVNYRMGPFGFLALPTLTSESSMGTSGNLGLLDQVAALKWVKNNIANFDGDAKNVTAFGISAGGRSICSHLISPMAKGLFQRAVIESSPCVRNVKTLATSEGQGMNIAAQAGCANAATQLTCLRSKSTTEILNAGGNSIGTWAPNVDGVIIPQQFTDAVNSGKLNKMPVMQGTTHDEYGWHVAIGFENSPVTVAQYPQLIQSMFGATAQPQILSKYPVGDYPTPGDALARVVTDANYSCPARATDQLLSAHVPTYGYEFNDQNAPDYLWVGLRGPVHAAETPYLFRAANAVSSGYFTPAQGKLSDQIIDYWSTFADKGNPNGRNLPYWPAYMSNSDKVQSLQPGNTRPIATLATDHKCGFWNSL